MYRFGPAIGIHRFPVFGFLLLVLVVAALVVGIVALVRLSRRPAGAAGFGPQRPPLPMDPAFVELRNRYARGEITSEEYATRAATLGYPVFPGPGPSGFPGPGPSGPSGPSPDPVAGSTT